MTRKHLTGLILAAGLTTGGTLAIVQAQDEAVEAPHDHEHGPTSVHAADGTHFDLTDADAYPDPDGFASLEERVSYAIGRVDGQQIPQQEEDFEVEPFKEGLSTGLAAESADFIQGYNIARRILDSADEMDVEQFLAGLEAGLAEENESRVIGVLVGGSYMQGEVPLAIELYIQGVKEGIAQFEAAQQEVPEGEEAPEAPETRLNDEQVSETYAAYGEYRAMLQEQEAIIDGGQGILNEMAGREGWIQTESGLLYKVVEAGEGASPDSNDIVTVHYEGKLTDGTVFDSSFERGEPAEFPVNRVIAGWTEAVQLMKPGATYEIALPYNLAYGERGNPPTIPAYSALLFKVQLISVETVPGPEPVPAPAPAPEPAPAGDAE